MKIRVGIVMLCCALLLCGCNMKHEKYQRISFDSDTLGESLEQYISDDTVVVNKAAETFPTQMPIYEITERNITEQEFQKLQQQLETPDYTSHWHGMKLEGNKISGSFADFGTGKFTMTEDELEALAWKTFNQIPFMDGDYEYYGIRGEEKLSNSEGEYTTRVMVSFYRFLDGVRVIGNDRCDLWFNDSGLVAIDITQFDYEQVGVMDTVTLEDATNKIKTPDAFSIRTNQDPEHIVETLQVDRIKLLLVNQYSEGCTVLQPIYNFMGTASLEDGSEAEFSSKVIAIPESYTYEKDDEATVS